MLQSYNGDDWTNHPYRELEEKYQLSKHGPEFLMQRIDQLAQFLRSEIRKELKIKEGAEKLSAASTDRNNSQQARTFVKKSNSRLLELQKDLADLNNFRLYVVGGVSKQGMHYKLLSQTGSHVERYTFL